MERIKTTNKKFMIFALFFVCCLIVSTGAYAIWSISLVPKQEYAFNPINKMNVALGIKVYDAEGNLKSSYAKNDDLILDNFRKFLQAFFTSSVTVSTTLKNTINQNKTVGVHAQYNTNTFADSSTGSSGKGGRIGIGIGTTSPARTNYNLETQKENNVAQDISYPSWSDTTGNITSQGTIIATSSYNVTEAGFFCNWVDNAGGENTFMLMHDTFGAIPVVSTDVVVVSYTLMLAGTTLNRNFGIWLEGLFSSIADGATLSKSFYYTSGGGSSSSTKVYVMTPSLDWFGSTYDQPIPTTIVISTSGSAPSRTDYAVTSQVEGYNVPNPVPSLGTTTIIVRTGITCTANRAIAGAYFMIQKSGGFCFIFWHTTFTVVNVPSGVAIRITFTLTC